MDFQSLKSTVIFYLSHYVMGQALIGIAIFLLVVGGYMYVGYNNVQTAQIEFGVDFNTPYYKVSNVACDIVIDSAGDVVIVKPTHMAAFNSVPCELPKTAGTLIRDHHYDSRATERSPIAFYYAALFVFFSIIVSFYKPISNYGEYPRFMVKFVVSWLAIAAMAFPITYSNYSSVSSDSVRGTEFTVATVYQTSDGRWVDYPHNTVGKYWHEYPVPESL